MRSPAAAGVITAVRAGMDELTLLVVAGVLLLASLFLPYWQITLHAPQYPKGLIVQAYVNRLDGAVKEVDGLNHYIGMMRLEDAAKLERQIAVVAIAAMALLAIASFWFRGVWRFVARVPAIIFPAIFVVDLYAWLYHAGHSLDAHAALSSSIKAFTPHILGVGTIGQFSTDAGFLPGFTLAVVAAVILLVTSILRRSPYDVSR